MYELVFWMRKDEHPGDRAITIVSELLGVNASIASTKLALGLVFGGVSLFDGDRESTEKLEKRGNELLCNAQNLGGVPEGFRFSILNRKMPN